MADHEKPDKPLHRLQDALGVSDPTWKFNIGREKRGGEKGFVAEVGVKFSPKMSATNLDVRSWFGDSAQKSRTEICEDLAYNITQRERALEILAVDMPGKSFPNIENDILSLRNQERIQECPTSGYARTPSSTSQEK